MVQTSKIDGLESWSLIRRLELSRQFFLKALDSTFESLDFCILFVERSLDFLKRLDNGRNERRIIHGLVAIRSRPDRLRKNFFYILSDKSELATVIVNPLFGCKRIPVK